MTETDQEIIRQILAGRKERFGDLMKRYGALCQFFFRQRCGWDGETARDLAQEAFLRAFRALAGLRPDSSFKAWFMTICRNLSANQARQNRKPTLPLDPEVHGTTQDVAADCIQRAAVQNALAVLPERQRDILEMKYFWDLRCEEIGEVLSLPAGTVKSELFYGRKRVMEILGKEGQP